MSLIYLGAIQLTPVDRHIVEKEIPIELSLLCELLDTLCGMLLLARRRRRGFSVHSLSLPQSWLTRLEGQFRGTYPGDTSLLWLYLQPMGTLLEQVYTGAGMRVLVGV